MWTGAAVGASGNKGDEDLPSTRDLTDTGPLGATAAMALAGGNPVALVIDAPQVPLVCRHEEKEAPSPAVVRRRTIMFSLAVALADLGAVVAGYALSKGYQLDGPRQTFIPIDSAIYLTVPLWLVVLALFGLYDRRQAVQAVEESRRVFQASSVSAAMVMLVTFFLDVRVSRGWVLAVWASCTALLTLERITFRRFRSLLRRNNFLALRTLLVGVNVEARTIARTLGRQSWLGYRVVGFVDVLEPSCGQVDGRPVIGSVQDIQEAVARTDAGVVIVAGTAMTPDLLQQIDRDLRPLGVEVRVSPGLPHVAASRIAIEPIDGLALLSLKRNQVTWSQALVKRAFDVVASAVLLLVAAPVLAVIAVAVKLSSPGPVLFRQARTGQGGRLFVIHKFRTMVTDAEVRLEDLRAANQADGVLFKLRHDPRVTRLGRILRSWGLDELPQLFNVLKGDMSLVGPRPEVMDVVDRYRPEHHVRFSVRPGMTGPMQVFGRGALTFSERTAVELDYIDNLSLSRDLRIIGQTIPVIIRGTGAY